MLLLERVKEGMKTGSQLWTGVLCAFHQTSLFRLVQFFHRRGRDLAEFDLALGVEVVRIKAGRLVIREAIGFKVNVVEEEV